MNNSKYHIWVVSPKNYSHVHVFDEVVLSLASSLSKLGLDITIHRDIKPLNSTPIIIGGNLLHAVPPVDLPIDSIIYNLEQIFLGSSWLSPIYLSALKSHKVWDYSKQNIQELAKLGITNVDYMPIGYVPELERLPVVNKDIDILFIGSMTDRRANIINSITNSGLKVHTGFNIYGAQRDLALAKSKIILNIHAYDAKVFEIVRVSHALANNLFVISETGKDLELEKQFYNGLVFADPHDFPKLCHYYLNNDEERSKISSTGQQIFRTMTIYDNLKKALDIK